MLEKLSNVLKKTTDKIANAIFLDKNLVEQIVKDLQRALIEADVNVQLVLEISQKIKKAAFDERIKGIEKKEHIIKLLHDELVRILGESRKIELQKQNIWLMLGLYGQGKCVHAQSKIQLADGNIIKAKELYEKYEKDSQRKELEEGFIIDTTKENLFVPSFNPKTAKIENKKVTHLWKLKKNELYEICLENGNHFSIKVTPEHPFFVLRESKVMQVRADEIKESDFIAIPTKVTVNGSQINLKEKLKELPLYIQLERETIKKLIGTKTIKEIHENLKNKCNYCKFTLDLKKGKIPIELFGELPNVLIMKEKGSHKFIALPTFINSDFEEFIGYVMGDGHIGKNYIEVVSEDDEIINRITELSKSLFNITPAIKRDLRTKRMFKIILSSKTLVSVFSIFGLKSEAKGRNLKIPEEILLSNDEIVRSFIKAYFDCDSSPANMQRYIELISESQTLIQQINMLLKRFSIVSSISEKIVKGKAYYRLSIKARYAEKYAERVGYLIKHKKERAEKYRKIGLIQGCGNQDMIPVGRILKELRIKLGFSIGEIQANAVYSYGCYEEAGLISKEKLKQLVEYYKIKKKGIYFYFLKDIKDNTNLKEKYSNAFINGIIPSLKERGIVHNEKNKIILSNTGQLYLQEIQKNNSEELIKTFEILTESNVCWMPIRKINPIENDSVFVYDLTVEDNHSFIAEGFVVHNTTSIGKLAAYYAKRGNKVCAIGLDVHRPAASEQLKQICDKLNIPAFINAKEKDPKKIWNQFELELKKYNLVLIDSAGRDALSSELVKEIKEISKFAKPTETFLVMSADVGQTAKKQAQTFKEAVNITGVIITKMDSTAKAGGALTACAEVKAPVVFIGTGEKPADLESFDSESFLSRLLGMGDLKTLMEKIQSVVDKDKIEETQKKLQEGKFSLRDLQAQLESMEGMGSFDKLIGMIPGLGKAKIPDEVLQVQQEKVKKWKHCINSMTKEEIENPEILEKETSRMQRIAKGSGTSTSDIRMLIKQYRMLREMISSQKSITEGGALDQKTMMKLAKKFGRKMRI